MTRFSLLSAFLLAFLNLAAAPLSVKSWTFNNGPEYPGATGSLKSDFARNTLSLTGNFTKGGVYVAAFHRFEKPLELQELRFRVKSNAVQMAVRFDDAEGQTHQHFLPLSGDSSVWQCIEVPVTGSFKHHWGGKNDGVLRGAIKRIDLVVSIGGFPNEQGILCVSDLQTVEKRADAELYPLDASAWKLNRGPEFPPGSDSSMKVHGNCVTLRVDCTRGGGYGALVQTFPFPLNVRKLRLKMHGSNHELAVRLIDSTGQCHNHLLKCSGRKGEEQSFVLDVTGAPMHWGGKNDGIFHDGLSRIELVVTGDFYGTSRKGETVFSDVVFESGDPQTAIASWNVADPVQLFRKVGDRSPVLIQADVPAALRRGLTYSYRDYSNNEVAAGSPNYDDQTGILSAPPPPGRGFFDLVYPGLGIRAGVMVDDPAPETPDEYFAVDSSFSWGCPPDQERDIRAYLKILRKNGIIWNRDRLSWSEIEKEQGKFDFGQRYGLYRKLAAEEGIRTLDTFHDTPAWTGAGRTFQPHGSKVNPYPPDKFVAGNSFVNIVSHWGKTLKALEVWNEPDYGFGNFFPPEYVTAFTKTISRAFADAGLDMQVVGGVISVTRPGTGYYDAFVRNGLLEDSDVVSYHTYADTDKLELELGALRTVELELAPERAGIPLWLTECGKAWPRGTYRATQPDDVYSAVEIVGKAVEMRALGLARYFAFEYKYYDEGHVNFGMMDAKNTPMRSMGAYAHLVRVLSHREYVGDLKGTNALRSRAFSDGTNIVVALYSGVKENRRNYFTLPAGLKVLRAAGIDGRPLKVKNNRLKASDGIAFLYLPMTEQNFIDSDTTAMRFYRLARDYKPLPRVAKPLILQPSTDLEQFEVDRYGFMTNDFKPVEFKAVVNNFGKEALLFDPSVRVDHGIRVSQAPAAVTVPPGGRAEVAFEVEFNPNVHPDRFRSIYLGDRNGNATDICFSIWHLGKTPVLPEKKISRAISLQELRAGENWKDISSVSCWIPCTGFIMEPTIGAKFRMFYNDDELICQVLVKDSTHHNPHKPDQAWRGDSVQMTIQMRPEDGQKTGVWDEITAAHTQQGNILYRHNGKTPGLLEKSKFSYTRFPEGYSFYEIRLNAGELGLELAPGRILGSTILVNSDSGKGREGYLAWGSGIASEKDDRFFQLFELK